MPDVRTIRVFIASPGDLAVERAAFKDVIEEHNDGIGDGARHHVRAARLGGHVGLDGAAVAGRDQSGDRPLRHVRARTGWSLREEALGTN